MRSLFLLATLSLASAFISFLSACADVRIVPDSAIPIEVFDKEGRLVEGYRGYSDAFIQRLIKDCEDVLGREVSLSSGREARLLFADRAVRGVGFRSPGALYAPEPVRGSLVVLCEYLDPEGNWVRTLCPEDIWLKAVFAGSSHFYLESFSWSGPRELTVPIRLTILADD